MAVPVAMLRRLIRTMREVKVFIVVGSAVGAGRGL